MIYDIKKDVERIEDVKMFGLNLFVHYGKMYRNKECGICGETFISEIIKVNKDGRRYPEYCEQCIYDKDIKNHEYYEKQVEYVNWDTALQYMLDGGRARMKDSDCIYKFNDEMLVFQYEGDVTCTLKNANVSLFMFKCKWELENGSSHE